MSEPTPETMKIMRRLIRELESAAQIQYGNMSWQLIRRAAAEIDDRWQKLLDEEINNGNPQ